MNREFAKFGAYREEYNPHVTEPGHFSNYPDVLIPADYHETGVDPISLEVTKLIRNTETPPPTPPELEPGQAGCSIFHEATHHYIAPIYEDKAYQRQFSTKLILANFSCYVPSVILISTAVVWKGFDHEVLTNQFLIFVLFTCSLLGVFLYIYFVGLCRNPPYVYLAFAFRVILTTGVFGLGMLLIHGTLLVFILQYDPVEEERYHLYFTYLNENEVVDDNDGHTNDLKEGSRTYHSPPYMGLLILLIMGCVQITTSVLLIKFKYDVTDYRIPVVIYTICYTVSPILTTIVLNDGFGGDQKGYDLIQIILGCMLSAILLMRTPHFIGRLFKGKVCPLTEGETMYAMLHYGF